ncbi:hypothetical protein LIER_27464 [Lithospermum erythrorhizon]|uniref:Uncharacterized protein n=1 Tax=Lithospermum erythrorhizon TaxID=34254 RepID=A0AAV3RFS4_LITER
MYDQRLLYSCHNPKLGFEESSKNCLHNTPQQKDLHERISLWPQISEPFPDQKLVKLTQIFPHTHYDTYPALFPKGMPKVEALEEMYHHWLKESFPLKAN